MIGLDESLGVGDAGGLGGRWVVDDVPAEAGQFEIADLLVVARARLRELSCHAAHLHHRHAEAVGEHDGHLQDDAQLFADVDGGELLEALGAVTGLEEERVPGSDLGE